MKKTAVTQPASSLELSSERQIVRTTRLIGVALFTSIDFLVPVASGKEKNQLEAEEPASIVAMTNCRRLIEVKDSFGVAEAILETAGPGERVTEKNAAVMNEMAATTTTTTGRKVLIPLLSSSSIDGVSGSLPVSCADELEREQVAATASLHRTRGSVEPQSAPMGDDRLQRCRERNRIHARKTRLRKKEHMQSLQQRSDELKQQQLRLKQVIKEKSTASILVGFATSTTDETDAGNKEDPRVEELLRRPTEEIPDSSKIPDLPALILPGQHASKKAKTESVVISKINAQNELPSEGFDLELLAKDRATCTPEELDQIRRERNRMHAKRTRDRKRLFMEEMGEICRQLEEENDLLRTHLRAIDPEFQDDDDTTQTTGALGVTLIAPSVPAVSHGCSASERSESPSSSVQSACPTKKRREPSSGHHIQNLLEAACKFELSKPDDATSSALFAVVEAINEASAKRRRTTIAQPTAVGC